MKRVKPDMDQVNYIIDVVSSITGIDKSKLLSRDRHDDVAIARFMLFYALHRYCRLAYFCIARILKRNHASVMYGISVADGWDEFSRFSDKASKENSRRLKQIMSVLEDGGDNY